MGNRENMFTRCASCTGVPAVSKSRATRARVNPSSGDLDLPIPVAVGRASFRDLISAQV